MSGQRWWRWGFVAVWMLAGAPRVAQASSEMELLLNKLVEKGILTSTEATQIRQEVAAEQNDQAASAKPAAKESASAASPNWQWNGDLMLRHEFRNRTGSGQNTTRQRVRLRVGFDAKVSEHLKAGARLATGSASDPISTLQTFNTSFNRVTFLVDRAYLEYTPMLHGLTETKITGGIIENPFWTPSQLVWDEDLNFDGAALHLAKHIGSVRLAANSGLFALQSDMTETAALWSVQGVASVQPFADATEEALKQLKLTGSLAYHDYQNVTRGKSSATAMATAGGTKGNNATLRDVNLINPAVQLATQIAGFPVTTYADYVHNTAAVAGQNDGVQLGVSVGQATVPWDLKHGWQAGYFFERLEPDATFGAFTYSDFGGSGTNHRGHLWWMKLATLKNSYLILKYVNTRELKGAKNHFDTVQIDWLTKF